MQFETKRLSHALDIVAMAIERRNTIPVLGTARVAMTLDRGGLDIAGTDLDIQIRATVGLPADNVAPSGPTERMIDMCMHAPDRVSRLIRAAGDEISVEQEDGDKLRLRGGPLDATIGGLPAADFPAIDISQPDHGFTATLGFEGIDMILRVAGAMSQEETRYYLNGVYLHHESDWTYKVVATDGHRLHVGTIELPDAARPLAKHGSTDRGIIIPRKTINILKRLRPRMASEQPVKISAGVPRATNGIKDLAPEQAAKSYNRAAFTFQAGDLPVEIVTKLIDGTFPDYTRVIPQHDPAYPSIAFKRRDLANAIDAISAGMLERTKAIKLTFDPSGRLIISAKWIDFGFEGKISIPATTSVKQPFEVGYNGKYLRQIIDASEGEDLTINTADSASPASIVDPEATDFRTVLMPMRI